MKMKDHAVEGEFGDGDVGELYQKITTLLTMLLTSLKEKDTQRIMQEPESSLIG